MLSSIGSAVVAVAMLLFVINMVKSLRVGAEARANPWDGSTLEWATSCPPDRYNFQHIPIVSSASPLWDAGEKMTVVHGLRVEDREVLLTTVMAAEPDVREASAEPSLWPFIAMLGTTVMFVSSIFSPCVRASCCPMSAPRAHPWRMRIDGRRIIRWKPCRRAWAVRCFWFSRSTGTGMSRAPRRGKSICTA